MRFLHLTPTEETVCHVVHHRCELAVIRRDVCQGILSSPEPLIIWSSENWGGSLFVGPKSQDSSIWGSIWEYLRHGKGKLSFESGDYIRATQGFVFTSKTEARCQPKLEKRNQKNKGCCGQRLKALLPSLAPSAPVWRLRASHVRAPSKPMPLAPLLPSLAPNSCLEPPHKPREGRKANPRRVPHFPPVWPPQAT